MTSIQTYNNSHSPDENNICNQLCDEVSKNYANLDGTENKLWHGAPVWFSDGNPIVGYSVLKTGVRLMFWSGVGFDEPILEPGTGKFKDASITYTSIDQINSSDIKRWLRKAQNIQWDYKNIVKRKGVLKRLK